MKLGRTNRKLGSSFKTVYVLPILRRSWRLYSHCETTRRKVYTSHNLLLYKSGQLPGRPQKSNCGCSISSSHDYPSTIHWPCWSRFIYGGGQVTHVPSNVFLMLVLARITHFFIFQFVQIFFTVFVTLSVQMLWVVFRRLYMSLSSPPESDWLCGDFVSSLYVCTATIGSFQGMQGMWKESLTESSWPNHWYSVTRDIHHWVRKLNCPRQENETAQQQLSFLHGGWADWDPTGAVHSIRGGWTRVMSPFLKMKDAIRTSFPNYFLTNSTCRG